MLNISHMENKNSNKTCRELGTMWSM